MQHFPKDEYVRPNKNWECGRLCEGCPCRIGPSPEGKCRATYECDPYLELKPGEEKGRWMCSRPGIAGGKCEHGPGPDGRCCNAVAKCQPRRTLRAVRRRFTTFTAIATVIILVICMASRSRHQFLNPGPVSPPHSSESFNSMMAGLPEGSQGCVACHNVTDEGIDVWINKFLQAAKEGLAPASLVSDSPVI